MSKFRKIFKNINNEFRKFENIKPSPKIKLAILPQVVVVFVHALYDSDARLALWREISQLDNSIPIIIYGDFNMILSSKEKKGGKPFDVKEVVDFQNFIRDLQLEDTGFSSGSKFT